MSEGKVYLGDGVYVRMEGRNLWLTTEDYGINQICLEPMVYAALTTYVKRIIAERQSTQGKPKVPAP